MGKRVNRYRLSSLGLKIEKSLNAEYCEGKSDLEIASIILHVSNFSTVKESIESGRRTFALKQIR